MTIITGIEILIRELRFEAGINSLCGSEEWTVLLTEVADRLEHMDKMLRSVHAATDLTAARRRALKGLTFPDDANAGSIDPLVLPPNAPGERPGQDARELKP